MKDLKISTIVHKSTSGCLFSLHIGFAKLDLWMWFWMHVACMNGKKTHYTILIDLSNGLIRMLLYLMSIWFSCSIYLNQRSDMLSAWISYNDNHHLHWTLISHEYFAVDVYTRAASQTIVLVKLLVGCIGTEIARGNFEESKFVCSVQPLHVAPLIVLPTWLHRYLIIIPNTFCLGSFPSISDHELLEMSTRYSTILSQEPRKFTFCRKWEPAKVLRMAYI